MTLATWNIVGDIGGTNARFGINRGSADHVESVASYEVANFPDFADVLKQLMQDIASRGLAQGQPSGVCLAVAGPPHLDTVSFTNSSWRFSRATVARHTGAQTVKIINDFAAVARALPALNDNDLDQIGAAGKITPQAPMVAIGAGTGLGVGALLHSKSGEPIVVTGEGGHVDFAPVTDVEAAVLKHLRARFGRVSIERLCCGDGIVNVYQAIAVYRNVPAPLADAASIGEAARQGEDALAQETMAMFFAVLGASAGNFALTFGALGGVYIAGGIIPRYLDLIRRSDFRARFLAKGRFADYLAAIPTYVITHSGIGLLGASLSLYD